MEAAGMRGGRVVDAAEVGEGRDWRLVHDGFRPREAATALEAAACTLAVPATLEALVRESLRHIRRASGCREDGPVWRTHAGQPN